MTKELAGKIAFVTGSGRGLGRVMADRLAELGADVAIHDLTWTAPAKYGEAADLDAVAKVIARHGGRVTARQRQHRRQGGGRENEGRDRSQARPGRHPGQLRRRRHRRQGRQARAERRARHSARGHQGADREQPLWHDPRLSGVRAADGEGGERIGDQHRLRRGAIRGDERGHLCGAQSRRHPLHALPRRGAPHAKACASMR